MEVQCHFHGSIQELAWNLSLVPWNQICTSMEVQCHFRESTSHMPDSVVSWAVLGTNCNYCIVTVNY